MLKPNQGRSSGNESLDSPVDEKMPPIIQFILANPVRVIWEPLQVLSGFSHTELSLANKYFSTNDPSTFVYSVCTDHIRRNVTCLDEKLIRWKLATRSANRFWPFWLIGSEGAQVELSQAQNVKKYLMKLWNESPPPWNSVQGLKRSLMSSQTGRLRITKTRTANGFVFLKCTTPTAPTLNGRQSDYPGYFTVCFEISTRSFFTMNSRIKCDPTETQYRYFESIRPGLEPPSVEVLKSTSNSKQRPISVLLILDRHIGDSLSLFSTYVEAISRLPFVELTVSTFRCTFFSSLKASYLKQVFPGRKIGLVHEPVDPFSFDLVLDPYDLVPGIFEKKPQNESGQVSIVSAIEFVISFTQGKRRDILDIHFYSLKRLGLLPEKTFKLPFIQFNPPSRAGSRLVGLARRWLQKRAGLGKNTRVVTFFPLGLSEDRKYPAQRLREVIRNILRRNNVFIALAGGGLFDRAELGSAISGRIENEMSGAKDRIMILFDKSFVEVTALILASDVVVAMDSGPLHLARACRAMPLALYSSKVHDPELFLAFPWYVDDASVQRLVPDKRYKDPHVAANTLQKAIEQKLRHPFD
jgi:ADP-heptose:LPS heptosyltransferase